MSEPKFTPGPWFLKEQTDMIGRPEIWVCFDELSSLASVRNGADDEEYGGEEAMLANAKLISQAPAMYALILKLEQSLLFPQERYPLSEMTADMKAIFEKVGRYEYKGDSK